MEEGVSGSDAWTRRLASGWIYWPACLMGLALVSLGILGPEAERRIGVEAQCASMQAEVDALRQTAGQLAAKDQALRSDREYLQRVVRRDQRLSRPGEICLPQPDKPGADSKDVPTAARLVLPPVMESLAKYGNPWLRVMVLVGGVTLLGIAVLLSLPGKQSGPQA